MADANISWTLTRRIQRTMRLQAISGVWGVACTECSGPRVILSSDSRWRLQKC